MTSGPWSASLLILLACTLSCGGGGSLESPPPIAISDLEPIPHPDLSRASQTLREQLGAGRASLEELLVDEGAERSAVAAAMGNLGRLYHAYGLAEAALACYRNAAGLEPTVFAWRYSLALGHAQQGRLSEAAAELERVLGSPSDATSEQRGAAYIRLGQLMLELDRSADARRAFSAVVKDPAFAAAAESGLGQAALRADEPTAAVRHFEQALELQPGAGALHHRLALAFRESGDSEAARAQLEIVSRGDVSFPDPLADAIEGVASTAGALLRRGGRELVDEQPGGAVEVYRRAVEADPTNVEARRSLALALVSEDRAFDTAIAELEQALAIEPENVWLEFDLGTYALSSGDPRRAIEVFEAVLDRAPDFQAARFNLANALIGLNRWSEAALQLDRLLEHNPWHHDARYLRAMAEQRLGRRDSAVAGLRELLEEEPRHREARLGLADLLLAEGDLAGAVEQYRGLISVATSAIDRAFGHRKLGTLLVRQGKLEKAAVHFRKALEDQPDDADVHHELARVLEQQGDLEAAIRHYGRVADLEPQRREAWLSESIGLVQRGAYGRAHQRLEAALRATESDPVLTLVLARLLATCPDEDVRDGRRALELAQSLYRQRASPDHIETLAMALAEDGQFDRAIQLQASLVEQVRRRGQQAHLERLQAALERYRKQQPMRIP